MAKMSISVTDEYISLLDEAVSSGEYASSSEVVREALREWRARRLIGQLWDEGQASGLADPTESMDDLKAEARRQRAQRG